MPTDRYTPSPKETQISNERGQLNLESGQAVQQNVDKHSFDLRILRGGKVVGSLTPTIAIAPVNRPLAPKAKLFKRNPGDKPKPTPQVSNVDNESEQENSRAQHTPEHLTESEHKNHEERGGKETDHNNDDNDNEKSPNPRTPPRQTNLRVPTPPAPKSSFKRERFSEGVINNSGGKSGGEQGNSVIGQTGGGEMDDVFFNSRDVKNYSTGSPCSRRRAEKV
jgi:hypothetical protein